MASNLQEKGQGLVEFALIFTVLLLVGFGALDLGRVFQTLITITNASREGARYLSLHPADNANGFSGTISAARSEAQGSIPDITLVQTEVSLCIDHDPFQGCDSGFPVRVKVSYPFKFFMGWLIHSPVTLSHSTEMIVP
ncbi:MAG: hypothetical protein A2Y53_09390 [Chloroflexi bacterium RBG_16_47_49]|nr:MAG: hypothetical protein A2Y53_09390 [Chloroflexi bacterium RBG_16_47_49]